MYCIVKKHEVAAVQGLGEPSQSYSKHKLTAGFKCLLYFNELQEVQIEAASSSTVTKSLDSLYWYHYWYCATKHAVLMCATNHICYKFVKQNETGNGGLRSRSPVDLISVHTVSAYPCKPLQN